jgi:hypothetical protein
MGGEDRREVGVKRRTLLEIARVVALRVYINDASGGEGKIE